MASRAGARRHLLGGVGQLPVAAQRGLPRVLLARAQRRQLVHARQHRSLLLRRVGHACARARPARGCVLCVDAGRAGPPPAPACWLCVGQGALRGERTAPRHARGAQRELQSSLMQWHGVLCKAHCLVPTVWRAGPSEDVGGARRTQVGGLEQLKEPLDDLVRLLRPPVHDRVDGAGQALEDGRRRRAPPPGWPRGGPAVRAPPLQRACHEGRSARPRCRADAGQDHAAHGAQL
jgi:hypothetical protein